MFCTLKLNFDEDILEFWDLATVLATFSKTWETFSNLLLTLAIKAYLHVCLISD